MSVRSIERHNETVKESETSAAIQWITAMGPNSWFWGNQVPAPPHIAQPVLSRMCRDESLGLHRVVRGLCWLGFPEDHEFPGAGPDLEIGALIYAGPGAGLAAAYPAWRVPRKPPLDALAVSS